jgi:hypothetical protein
VRLIRGLDGDGRNPLTICASRRALSQRKLRRCMQCGVWLEGRDDTHACKAVAGAGNGPRAQSSPHARPDPFSFATPFGGNPDERVFGKAAGSAKVRSNRSERPLVTHGPDPVLPKPQVPRPKAQKPTGVPKAPLRRQGSGSDAPPAENRHATVDASKATPRMASSDRTEVSGSTPRGSSAELTLLQRVALLETQLRSLTAELARLSSRFSTSSAAGDRRGSRPVAQGSTETHSELVAQLRRHEEHSEMLDHFHDQLRAALTAKRR